MLHDMLIASIETAADASHVSEVLHKAKSRIGDVAVVAAHDAASFQAIANRCGKTAWQVAAKDLKAALATHELPKQPIRQPDALVVFQGVDGDLLSVLAVLYEGPILKMEGLSDLGTELDDVASAMILWAPEMTDPQALAQVMRVLGERDILAGYLPCFGTSADFFAVMKALSFPDLPSDGATGLVTSLLANKATDDQGTPALENSAEYVRRAFDVLVIQGHGNPLDTSLTSSAILCAAAANEAQTTRGLFPCFQGGVCFRRAGRYPNADLISGKELDALFVFAQICRYFPMFGGQFNAAHTVARQVMASSAVGTVSSIGPVWSEPDLLVLGMSLIANGDTFGEVAAKLEALHTEKFGYETGMPPGTPCIVAFGNPIARLAPRGVPHQQLRQRQDGVLVANWTNLPTQRDTLIAVSLPDGVYKAPLNFIPRFSDTQVEHVEYPLGSGCYYLLVVGDHPNTITLEALPAIATDLHLLVDEFSAALDFWPVFLDYYQEARENSGGNTKIIQDTVLAVTRTKRKLLKTRVHLGEEIKVSAHRFPKFLRRTLSQVTELQDRLIEMAIDIQRHERFNEAALTTMRPTAERLGPTGPCSCGKWQIQSQEFRGSAGNVVPVIRHYCPCNDAGYDSGHVELSWNVAPQSVQRGKIYEIEVEVAGCKGTTQVITGVTMIASFSRSFAAKGDLVSAAVAPGNSVRIQCQARIPNAFENGLCEVVFLAVINGTFVHRCYLADVTD